MLIPEKSSEKQKSIVMIGCFDTKSEDFAYLHNCLVKLGLSVISINTGIFGSTDQFKIDIEAEEVATAANIDLYELRDKNHRGIAIEKMGLGASNIIEKLISQDVVSGVIGMGGGGGTYIILSAMQSVPLGIPKLCLSTLATKDLSEKIGSKDILLMPSIVDVAGLNSISRLLISQAAGAINGMVHSGQIEQAETSGSVAISIFGNTTPCVDLCSSILKQEGFDVLTFHSVGVGGRTMESLIRENCFDAVLDITTTELADDLCGGICSAGPDRLTTASQMGIPQVVVPGCMDMVNYGAIDSVPDEYKTRLLYSWAPDVTLMRTNVEENSILGERIAQKLNKSTSEVCILIPLKGLSQVSAIGEVFYDQEADQALFQSIKKHSNNNINIVEIDANINDQVFAEKSVEILLQMIKK